MDIDPLSWVVGEERGVLGSWCVFLSLFCFEGSDGGGGPDPGGVYVSELLVKCVN